MDIKIATMLLPHYMNKINRLFIQECAETILEMGNAIRFNGSGGVDSPLNIDSEMLVTYLSDTSYYGLTNLIPLPTEEQKLDAYKIALQSFPNMKTWEQSEQNKLLASVYSIYGYTGNKSDLILIYKGAHRRHKNDNSLFDNAVKLAKASGVKIKYLTAR